MVSTIRNIYALSLLSYLLGTTTGVGMDAPRKLAEDPALAARLLHINSIKNENMEIPLENNEKGNSSSLSEQEGTSPYLGRFNKELLNFPQFHQLCVESLHLLDPAISPQKVESYITLFGNQFDPNFLPLLASNPNSETSRHLVELYSKFYFMGIVSYLRKDFLGKNAKHVFPANLSSQITIKNVEDFGTFLNNAVDIELNFHNFLLDVNRLGVTRTYLTSSYYKDITKRLETKFRLLVRFKDSNHYPEDPMQAVGTKRKNQPTETGENHLSQKRKLEPQQPFATAQVLNNLGAGPGMLEQNQRQVLPPLPQTEQRQQILRQMRQQHLYALQARTFQPQQHMLQPTNNPLVTKYITPEGKTYFKNSKGAIFYGEPLKAHPAIHEQRQKLTEIITQLFKVSREQEFSWDNFETAYSRLDAVQTLLKENKLICEDLFYKFQHDADYTTYSHDSRIIIDCARMPIDSEQKDIPAHEYAQAINNTLTMAYDLAVEKNILMDFFSKAFIKSDIQGLSYLDGVQKTLMDWYTSTLAKFEQVYNHEREETPASQGLISNTLQSLIEKTKSETPIALLGNMTYREYIHNLQLKNDFQQLNKEDQKILMEKCDEAFFAEVQGDIKRETLTKLLSLRYTLEESSIEKSWELLKLRNAE